MTVLDKLKLTGKVAIVTGAGRGLGRAMALSLAEAGADIVATARTQSQVEETADMVRGHGRACEWICCDVTDSSSVKAMVESAVDRFRRDRHPREQRRRRDRGLAATRWINITDDHWRIGIDTNLTGAVYCSRAVDPAHAGAGRRARSSTSRPASGCVAGRNNFMYTSAPRPGSSTSRARWR